MELTVGRLRDILAEAMVEAKVGASASYMAKERVREHLQELIVKMVKSKEIKDERGLDSFCADAEMALEALKMVPIEAWVKIASQGTKKV